MTCEPEQVVCPSIVDLQKEVTRLKNRIVELSIKLSKTEKRILERVRRGFTIEAKDDPFYDRKHLEKPVRDIINDILEEHERMEG